MLDPFNLMVSFLVFMIYAAVCGVATLFTFFMDAYIRLDEKLRLEVFRARALNPLEENIQGVDNWLMNHHKIVGPLLIVLSITDLKLMLDAIYKL